MEKVEIYPNWTSAPLVFLAGLGAHIVGRS